MKLKIKPKISVIGMGYVGCGNALMLAKFNEVSVVDIDKAKVDNFNAGRLPILDKYAQDFYDQEELNISGTSDLIHSIQDSNFIILSLPTNFDENSIKYDTNILEEVATTVINATKSSTIIIKSTVDIGYTEYLRQKLNTKRIIFSPEFLREGHALKDNLFPSRVIIGGTDNASIIFRDIMVEAINDLSVPVMMMGSNEAESVKLFSNTYLAMRVAFFNELDTFCLDNQIDPREVITGVSHDKRIGNFYNNPSFGFGGLCLPKDSMQLLQRFEDSPHSIIKAIQDSNKERAIFIIEKIISYKPKTVGIYKLAMKKGADNSRDSSIFNIIYGLRDREIEVIIHDPASLSLDIAGVRLIQDFKEFINDSDLIVTNRIDDVIKPFSYKIFSRDVYSSDE